MTALHVLRVFTDPHGDHGNPLGVFLDGRAIPDRRRQELARELGFSETVFVDDVARGAVRIFTPASELRFAGHPLVGVAWLIAREHRTCNVVRPPAGDVRTWTDAQGLRWIRGQVSWAPRFALRRHATPAEIDALDAASEPADVDAWAWHDESRGSVRARVFVPTLGIPEDQATGSAAVVLAVTLAREIHIRQGSGAELFARPAAEGAGEVGGRVVQDDAREVT